MTEQEAWEAYRREAQETMRLFEDPYATPAERSRQMLKSNAAHKVYMATIRGGAAPTLTPLEEQRSELLVHIILLLVAFAICVGVALPEALERGGWLAITGLYITAAIVLFLGLTAIPMVRQYLRDSANG